jgi:sulfur carrier protein
MQVFINQQPHDLPDGATVSAAVAAIQAVKPYAVAVNLAFVPQAQHGSTLLHDGDRVEIIRPVTGG